MENEAIVDFIQLTEWLQTRDQKNARIIANRSALRSLPTLESLVKLESQNFRDNLILPTFRACISFSMYFSGIKYSKARSAANAKIPKNPDTHFAISSVDHALMACFSMPSPLIYIAANAVQQSAISIYGYTNEINSPKNIDPWKIIETEISFLEKITQSAETLYHEPLWLNQDYQEIKNAWERLKTYLLSAKDEDWGVWIDWYEAQLAGVDKASINHALEEAILLIPDKIWEAGPKIANAEIRRLMQVHSRETLDTNLSPEPVIANGKVTVAANATADVPDDLANILALPERLGEAIDTLLDMLAIKANACPVIVPPLGRYRKHLGEYGPHPMLDRLNDLHQIVRDEYLGLHRERFFDGERGLRRALLTFFDLHKKLRSEFAKDAIREQAIRTYRLDPGALDAAGLIGNIDAFEQGAQAAADAGVATPEFLDYATELSEAMRHALQTPLPGPPVDAVPDDPLTDPIPNEKLWPVRWLLKGGAFAGRLYTLLTNPVAAAGSIAGIIGFLDSNRGERFVKALKAMWDAIFGDEDP